MTILQPPSLEKKGNQHKSSQACIESLWSLTASLMHYEPSRCEAHDPGVSVQPPALANSWHTRPPSVQLSLEILHVTRQPLKLCRGLCRREMTLQTCSTLKGLQDATGSPPWSCRLARYLLLSPSGLVEPGRGSQTKRLDLGA